MRGTIINVPFGLRQTVLCPIGYWYCGTDVVVQAATKGKLQDKRASGIIRRSGGACANDLSPAGRLRAVNVSRSAGIVPRAVYRPGRKVILLRITRPLGSAFPPTYAGRREGGLHKP